MKSACSPSHWVYECFMGIHLSAGGTEINLHTQSAAALAFWILQWSISFWKVKKKSYLTEDFFLIRKQKLFVVQLRFATSISMIYCVITCYSFWSCEVNDLEVISLYLIAKEYLQHVSLWNPYLFLFDFYFWSLSWKFSFLKEKKMEWEGTPLD